MKNYKLNHVLKNQHTFFFSIIGLLLLSVIILPATELKRNYSDEKKESKGREIFINKAKYALNYLGLRLCDPIPDQHNYTLVYKLGYTKLTNKILLPVQQVLTQNKLQAGKLTKFPNNQGFSYRVLYKYKHIGNIIVLNSRTVDTNTEQFIPKEQPVVSKKKPENNKSKPKFAIIIDDFGYSNSNTVLGFLEMNLDLTISIIPGHKYSTWTAEEAKINGKEVIIHMPMASDKEHLNKGEADFILSETLSKNNIEHRIHNAMLNIPNAKGMNNHMGSVASCNPDVVLPLLNVLKKKNLYFIDSLTSPLSIIYENCLIQDIATARRRLFLDNVRNEDEIIKQIYEALKIAKRNGSIIVTAHIYSETLSALQNVINSGGFNDIEICFASQLLE